MTERNYDPELAEIVGLLPSSIEWGPPESMPQARASQAVWSPAVEQRPDVVREDRVVPGREGDPDVEIRIYKAGAVALGDVIGDYISERLVAYVGGSLFILFAVSTLVDTVSK